VANYVCHGGGTGGKFVRSQRRNVGTCTRSLLGKKRIVSGYEDVSNIDQLLGARDAVESKWPVDEETGVLFREPDGASACRD